MEAILDQQECAQVHTRGHMEPVVRPPRDELPADGQGHGPGIDADPPGRLLDHREPEGEECNPQPEEERLDEGEHDEEGQLRSGWGRVGGRRRPDDPAQQKGRDADGERDERDGDARVAGVQRHTVYQHFPDELALSGACTAYGLALDPQPDPAVLARIPDPAERLRAALGQQYGYYRRNESLLANVARDAPLLQQRLQAAGLDWRALPEAARGFLEQPARLRDALVPGWRAHRTRGPLLRAALGLALDFGTWRTLAREQGLDEEQAIELMVEFVVCAARTPDPAASE